MKDAVPELVVMTDVCVDEYTDHGHCGVLRKRADGEMEVDNDATHRGPRARWRVVHAQAGADVVAPSDMMDGRVARDPHARSTTRASTGTSHPLATR